MVQFLGSENGTDFGPDPRTRTVHICSVVNIPVLQVLHLYVNVCICVRARARLRDGARARQCVDACARAGASAHAARDAPQQRKHTQRVC